MGQKELLRVKILEMARQGKMTLKAASASLRLSCRQAIRLYAAYRKEGEASLIRGNYGRKSNNRTAETVREKAVKVYREKYYDFGPTFAAEKLAEVEGLQISVSVLRRLLIEKGEWKGKLRSAEHRSRRLRLEHFGGLAQFDGSRHKWLEGRGPPYRLITMTGDATSTRLPRFFEGEAIAGGAMEVFSCWIRSYGISGALYCDK
jgi:hypothetical protein